MTGMAPLPSATPPPPSGASLPGSGSRPAAAAPGPPAAAAPPPAAAPARGGSPLKNVVAAPDQRVVIDVDADSTRSTADVVADDSDDGDGFSDMEEDELESSSEDEPIGTSKPPTEVVRAAVRGPSRTRRPQADHRRSRIRLAADLHVQASAAGGKPTAAPAAAPVAAPAAAPHAAVPPTTPPATAKLGGADLSGGQRSLKRSASTTDDGQARKVWMPPEPWTKQPTGTTARLTAVESGLAHLLTPATVDAGDVEPVRQPVGARPESGRRRTCGPRGRDGPAHRHWQPRLGVGRVEPLERLCRRGRRRVAGQDRVHHGLLPPERRRGERGRDSQVARADRERARRGGGRGQRRSRAAEWQCRARRRAGGGRAADRSRGAGGRCI